MQRSGGELPFDALEELAGVPFDDAVDVLAHVQRRKLLFALLARSPRDVTPSVADDAADEAVAPERLVEMTEVHLPKLVDYGFVDWDREINEVRRGPNFEEVRPLLELTAEHEDELPG